MRRQVKPHWYEVIIRYWPALVLIGGGIGTAIKSFDEIRRLRSDYNALKEQVQNQYRIQREMNDATHKEIEEIFKWIEYHKGYSDAKKPSE